MQTIISMLPQILNIISTPVAALIAWLIKENIQSKNKQDAIVKATEAAVIFIGSLAQGTDTKYDDLLVSIIDRVRQNLALQGIKNLNEKDLAMVKQVAESVVAKGKVPSLVILNKPKEIK